MIKDIVYIGCPYTHKDPQVRQERFEKVTQAAAKLVERGENILSPITHSHPLAKLGNLPTTWDFWKDYDTSLLIKCKKMYVLMLPGWKESKGLQAEINVATFLNIQIDYLDYNEVMKDE